MAANGESVSNGPVSNVSVSNREDEMGSLLPRGSSLYGFRPPHGDDGVFFEVVDFANFLSVSLVIWVDVEGGVVYYDAVGV